MVEMLSMGPIPALFKIIRGESVWACGVAGCKGRLATVRCLTDEEDVDGEMEGNELFLILPDSFEKRSDGIYAKTKRSAARSPVAHWHLQRAGSFDPEFPTFGGPDALCQKKARGRRRQQQRSWEIREDEVKKNPVHVRCPSCGRVCIIKTLVGIPS